MPSSKNTSRSDAGMRPPTSAQERRVAARTVTPSWKRGAHWLLGAAVGLALPAWGAEAVDAERGRLLYENHCVVCHTSKVHRRIPPLPMDLKDLRLIVAAWAKGQDLRWSDSDISDVVEYLDRTHYRMIDR